MRNGRILAGGAVLVPRARRAQGPLERARGLLARPEPLPGEALLIEPCSGIHTWAMGYPIDAAFLDRSGRVLRVVERLAPWRFAACPGARAVLELAAGETARLGLKAGMEARWQDLTETT